MFQTAIRFLIPIAVAFALFAAPVEAACTGGSPSWTASVDLASVTSCVNSAVDGDTVNISAGVATWTSGLAISKAITLAGAGVGNTIIRDGIVNANVRLITFTLVANRVSRMTGIEFRDGGRVRSFNGTISVFGSYAQGDSRRIRIDHCRFDHLNDHALDFFKAYGVVDHNTALYTATRRFANVWGVSGSGDDFGDGSWTTPARFGTDQFLFFEDNTLTFDAGQFYAHIDGFGGARYVARHNTVNRGNFIGHGTESSGRYRGTRAMEVYQNHYYYDGTSSGLALTTTRSGSILVHNNTAIGYGHDGGVLSSTCDRVRYVDGGWNPWGNSDGTSQWDVNDPGPFESGTVTSVSGRTIIVSGVSWTPNGWAGYSLKRTSGGSGASEIASNTNNSITFYEGFSGELTFNPGDSFQIWRVRHSLDCPGMGQSGFLGGLPAPARPPGGVGQVIEPMYEWNNFADTQDVDFAPHEALTRLGEQYFNDTVAPGYTPFTYPHPLISGLSSPTNLRIVPF